MASPAPQPESRTFWRAPLASFLAVAAIVWARVLAEPITPYGSNGSEFIEHAHRVTVVARIRGWLFEGDPHRFHHLVDELDQAFPPLLHLLSAPLTLLFDGAVEPVVLASVLWVGVLALGVGATARGLGGGPVAVSAAMTAAIWLPGVHGPATRYYYDLPMAALCFVTTGALTLLWTERPWRAGVVGGALGFLACILKWTALPFLAFMFAGLALTKPPPLRHRLEALGLTTAALGGAVGVFLALAGSENSLLATTRESATEAVTGDQFGLVRAATGLLPALFTPDPLRATRLDQNTLGLVFSVFSPVLALATAVLLGVWLLRSRRGLAFVLATAGGQFAFLVLWVRPIDERFHLVLAPALGLGAAFGWETLKPHVRRWLGPALLGVAALVALDFHHAPPTALTQLWTDSPRWGVAFDRFPPPVRPRGLGATTSAQGRGWVRRDEAWPFRGPLRDALIAEIRACRPSQIAAESSGPWLHEDGSHDWIAWELARDWVRESSLRPPAIIALPVDAGPGRDDPVRCEEAEPLEEGVVVLAAARVGGPPSPPRCPSEAAWRHLATVDDPEGGSGVALWSPFGVEASPK